MPVLAPDTECIWAQASKSLKVNKGHGNLVPGASALVDCLGHPDSSCVRERTEYSGRGVLWKSAKLNEGSSISSTNTEKITGRYTTNLCMTIPKESGVGGGAGCAKGQTHLFHEVLTFIDFLFSVFFEFCLNICIQIVWVPGTHKGQKRT